MPEQVPVYNGLSAVDLDRMEETITTALRAARARMQPVEDLPAEEDSSQDVPIPEIPPFDDLIGIDSAVYRQINGALQAGHRHLLFYGPPGTGKTTLAQNVASVLNEEYRQITGSADWTSQDIIGGYHPLADGGILFLPGILLRDFDKPLVFDELNRCDIDKVIGPLFTVLSGQSTTLPYLTNPDDPTSPRIEINPQGVPDPPRAYAPGSRWRLIATINSIDKASLYQMSYALTRRFAWIFVDVPRDPVEFIKQYMARSPELPQGGEGAPVPLGEVWRSVNSVRPVGAAPILDIIRLIQSQNRAFNFFENTRADTAPQYLDGFYVFLMPMLDGVLREQGHTLAELIAGALNLTMPQADDLRSRIEGLTI